MAQALWPFLCGSVLVQGGGRQRLDEAQAITDIGAGGRSTCPAASNRLVSNSYRLEMLPVATNDEIEQHGRRLTVRPLPGINPRK